jgi:hypothetical protein
MDNTQHQDEWLEQLFGQLPEEQSSGDFTAQVMQRVMLKKQCAEKRQKIFRMAGYGAAGGSAVATLVAVACFYTDKWFHLVDIRISLSPVKDGLANVASLFATASHQVFAVGLAAMLLLGADLLIQYTFMRKGKRQ